MASITAAAAATRDRLSVKVSNSPLPVPSFFAEHSLEIRQRELQSFLQPHFGLPDQNTLRLRHLRAPALRIVLWQRLAHNQRRDSKTRADAFGELQTRELL